MSADNITMKRSFFDFQKAKTIFKRGLRTTGTFVSRHPYVTLAAAGGLILATIGGFGGLTAGFVGSMVLVDRALKDYDKTLQIKNPEEDPNYHRLYTAGTWLFVGAAISLIGFGLQFHNSWISALPYARLNAAQNLSLGIQNAKDKSQIPTSAEGSFEYQKGRLFRWNPGTDIARQTITLEGHEGPYFFTYSYIDRDGQKITKQYCTRPKGYENATFLPTGNTPDPE